MDFTGVSKEIGDVTAGAVAFAAIAQWLPSIAAACSIVWFCIRIYDWLFNKRPPGDID